MPPTAHSLPANTTFYFSINYVRPDFTVQLKGSDNYGVWKPPTLRGAIVPAAPAVGQSPNPLFRWRDGNIRHIHPNSCPGASQLNSFPNSNRLYGSATVFTQQPEAQQLVCVPFDARRADVEVTAPYRWVPIGFDHDAHPGDEHYVYSYVSNAGGSTQLATTSTASPYVAELIEPLHVPNDPGWTDHYNAGLTGQLPLLLALIAFSCPPGQLVPVLQESVRRGLWRPHGQPNCRSRERGVVVSVWTDASTGAARLKKLEEGHYGPFFGP